MQLNIIYNYNEIINICLKLYLTYGVYIYIHIDKNYVIEVEN